MKFAVEPHGLPSTEGNKPQIKVQLLDAGGRELWSRQTEVQGDGTAAIPFEIPLPDEEGVYDVAISAPPPPVGRKRSAQPLSWKRTIAERRVQAIVPKRGGQRRRRPMRHGKKWGRSIGQPAMV